METSLTISNADIALTSLWLLIGLLWSVRAFIMLLSIAVYILLFLFLETDFQIYVVCSVLYFFIAPLNIKISKEFRTAFSMFGVVYFIGAIDQFAFTHLAYNTRYDGIQDYLVITINAYILAYLLSGGRRDNVYGAFHYCAKCLNRYNLHIPIRYQIHKEKKSQ